MYSFHKKSKNSQRNSQLNNTFKKQLNQIFDNDQYNCVPQIQQYNFISSPKQKKQSSLSKRFSISKQRLLQEKKSLQQEKPAQSEKSEVQIFNSDQNYRINNLNRKVEELLKQNEQLKKDKNQLNQKIQSLERQIAQINKQLKSQKNTTNQYQLQSNHSLSLKKSLRSRNSKENSFFIASPKSSKQKTISASSPLVKQLLLSCNQSRQFGETKRLGKLQGFNQFDIKEDQFYEYKDTKDCFNPFFDNLSRQLQLRCKKGMIRDKVLIYSDDFVEIGCISRKTDDHEFQMNVVITNIHNQSIKDVNVAYLHKNDIEVSKEVKSTNLTIVKSTKHHTVYAQLSSTQQIKESLGVLVNTVDFRCILISVEFTDCRGEIHKIIQILPGCKHRLFSYLVPTPVPIQFRVIERVVMLDKKILPDLEKLKQYYKWIHFTTDRHKNSQAVLKLQFLSKQFFATSRLIGTDKLVIGVHYLSDYAHLAEKILGEFHFIFER